MGESVSSQNNGLRTYRPSLDKFIFNTPDLKDKVAGWLNGVKAKEASRALLLTGGFGLGKTTLALAVCDALGASENDIQQINCASARTLDDARDLLVRLNFSPAFGTYRVLILDEVHQMVANAQQAFLTPIENLSPETLLIACTSAPENLVHAFRSRFFEIRIEPYSEESIVEALENLPLKEKLTGKQRVAIARSSNGNMRRAIAIAEGGSAAGVEENLMRVQNAIDSFYTFLMAREFPSIMYILTQLGEGERRNFFDRNLSLLEGTWMTLSGQATTVAMNDQRVVAGTLAKFPQDAKQIARYYRDLASLQDKPFQMVKAWIMTLAAQ